MPRYNIVLVQPAGYIHSQCFAEIAKLLLSSLSSLGFDCKLQLNTFDPAAINILLGYNVITDPSTLPPCDIVIYQLEQLSDREGWFKPAHLEMYRRAREVWDYAPQNIDFLRDKGVQNVKLLPIGFHEELRVIQPQIADVDVLFYGSLNERRRAVLNELANVFSVKALFGVYGAERDHWIARSKIVLNVHYFDTQIIEQPRISYLLNNERFVLSEDAKVNPYGPGLVTVPYEQVVSACGAWLDKPVEREAMAKTGFALFRDKPMTEYLRQVLVGRPS